VTLLLPQPHNTRTTSSTHNCRTGVDYFVNQKTTVGAAFTGTYLKRKSNTASTIEWLDKFGALDSTISTTGLRDTKLKQAGLNFNARHTFDANRELLADVDLVKYNITNDQYFENQLLVPGSIVEASKGHIPSTLNIFSAKADYSHRFKNTLWESGIKSARVETDNLAEYFIRNSNQWEDVLGKSNHFLYT